MRRFLDLVLVTVLLAFASDPAFAAPAPNCPMAHKQMAADHAKMDCCAPACAAECAIACPVGLVPQLGSAPKQRVHAVALSNGRVQALLSIDLADADPPPRTTFS